MKNKNTSTPAVTTTLSLTDAKALVKGLNFTRSRQWVAYTKKADFPANLPVNPIEFYGENWISWADFFGNVAAPAETISEPATETSPEQTELIAGLIAFGSEMETTPLPETAPENQFPFLTTSELEESVKITEMTLEGENDSPENIAAELSELAPELSQEETEAAGRKSRKKKEFLPYKEAVAVVNAAEPKMFLWADFQKWERPANIPSNPQLVYGAEFNMREWLGTSKPDRKANNRPVTVSLNAVLENERKQSRFYPTAEEIEMARAKFYNALPELCHEFGNFHPFGTVSDSPAEAGKDVETETEMDLEMEMEQEENAEMAE